MTVEDQIRLAVQEAIAPLVEEIRELKSRVNGTDGKSLTAKEAAKFIGVSLNRIRELSHDTNFYPALWVSEGRVVFSKNLLVKWLDERAKKAM